MTLLGGREASRDEASNYGPGEFVSDNAGAEAEHVHVVMFHALVRGVGVVTDPGPHPGVLIEGDADADTAAAQDDPPFCLTSSHGFADASGEVRVVVEGIFVVGSQILEVHAQALELSENVLLEVVASVVRGDNKFHVFLSVPITECYPNIAPARC